MFKSLSAYIRKRLEEHDMSGRAAAATMEISQPHFARIASGQVERPGPGICRKIGELFGDSPTMVMRLAGWFEDDDRDAFLQEIMELSKKDPRFEEMVRTYQSLTSEEAREAFLAMSKTALEVFKQRGAEEND